MQVIPAINAATFEGVQEQLAFVKQNIPEHKGFVHLDVTDGFYSTYPLWNNPYDLSRVSDRSIFEVHLMIRNPEKTIDSWLQPCVGRIIVQSDAVSDPNELLNKCTAKHIQFGISFAPHASIENFIFPRTPMDLVQVLAVHPGAAGQKFGEEALQKIHALRKMFPSGILEVDGGMTPETAKRIQEAGADTIVSASYIMKSSNPREAYQELLHS
ncbi:MAG: hypothetical protein KGI50_02895 [Patescibacteria group bacterium]|nr:hypothetical protein [Patescibacteria group bacterium]MDE2438545.1 hypothetical protein [Patescibacteria group bacterium]